MLDGIYLYILGCLGGLFFGLFACLSIRCPECRLSWAWYAVTKQNLGEWIPWLVSVVNGAQNVDFQVTKRGGTIRGQADY